MGYKKTGNPPGRPRKTLTAAPADQGSRAEAVMDQPFDAPRPLSRLREGFRRAFVNPAEGLHRPPRFGKKRQHVGKRPILHPNVIKAQ